MKNNPIYDEDKLKKYYKGGNSAYVSKHFHVSPREACRALRNSGIISTPEPDSVIRLRIKDTEYGRKLASILRLKVGVIYPDELNRSDSKSTE